MSSLASFVASITDPLARRPNIEDDGNEETRALITGRIKGEEGAKSAFNRVSKLRLQNAELLGDTNPRYKGEKTTRKNIKGEKESFDPDLAKFCILEDNDAFLESANEYDDEDHDNDSGGDERAQSDNDDSGDEDELAFVPKNGLSSNSCTEDDFMRMAEDNEEYSDEEEEDGECSEEIERHSDEDNFNESDDNDASEMADDKQELSDDGSDILQKKFENKAESSVQMFSKEDSIQVSKGIAVKNQCHIFDKLFEARIGLQKVASISNQLPQANTYKAFLQNKFYELYKTNLVTARKAVKKLIVQILDLQKCILSRNSEIEPLVNFEDRSEDEESDGNSCNDNKLANEDKNKKSKGSKRKHEEFEEILRKRHKNMIPFRDDTLNKWQEKSKLLVNQSRGNFGKFEIAPTVQIKNILTNKDELIKRTQMTGLARGNVNKVLGKEADQNSHLVEEFDPEIFDDSDFYSRLLEDFLKSKISVSKSMTEVSMHWVGIQKLRKKSKRKIDANASKGRKLTHQVITKQQHFMAPTKYSAMGDEAINKLYTSLFGNNSIK